MMARVSSRSPGRRSTAALVGVASRLALAVAGVQLVATGSAHAQLAAPTPVRQSVDANGVDLFTLTYTLAGPRLSIGQSQGMTYQRYDRGFGWTDDYVVTLVQNAGSTPTVTVNLGSDSDLFAVNGQTFTATQGNGATLVLAGDIYAYTRADGTRIRFDRRFASPRPFYANLGRAVDVISPDGQRLSYSYVKAPYCIAFKPGTGECIARGDEYRVSRVVSSYGYALTLDYVTDFQDPDSGDVTQWTTIKSASLSNLAVVGSPTPTMKLAMTPDSSGFDKYELTDAAGRTTVFRRSANSVSMLRPDSTSDDIIWSRTGNFDLSVTNAAGTTRYAYSDSDGTRTTTVTDPLGQVTRYTFDITGNAAARMRTVTDALSNTTRYDYDQQGRLKLTTLPEGNATEVTYIDAMRPAVTKVRQIS